MLLSKVVELLVNGALRKVSEVILDESQMGFRSMRGCPDAIFFARRVLEEFRVTQTLEGDVADDDVVYALFVDLRKALETIWRILRVRVACRLVLLLLSLSCTMAWVHVSSTTALSDRFSMRVGVRQGAVEAPTLVGSVLSCLGCRDLDAACSGMRRACHGWMRSILGLTW